MWTRPGLFKAHKLGSCFHIYIFMWLFFKIFFFAHGPIEFDPLMVSSIPIVTWYTTERREIRNFPCPSVFELTGRQRLAVKKRNRNVDQFFAAEVTNPGQNER